MSLRSPTAASPGIAGIAIILAAALCGCRDVRSPTSPTRPPAKVLPEPSPPAPAPLITNVKGTMTVSSALTKSGGYQYTVQIELTEGAGVARTITSVDIAKEDVWGPYPPLIHFGPEAWGSSSVLPANGTLKSRPLVVTVEVPEEYYFRLNASVAVSNEVSVGSWRMAVDAATPPMPQPPPGATFTLTGIVTDEGFVTRLAGVTVEVQDGENAGRKTTTGVDGTYTLAGLRPDSFLVGFSKPGYKVNTYRADLMSNLMLKMWIAPDTSSAASEFIARTR